MELASIMRFLKNLQTQQMLQQQQRQSMSPYGSANMQQSPMSAQSSPQLQQQQQQQHQQPPLPTQQQPTPPSQQQTQPSLQPSHATPPQSVQQQAYTPTQQRPPQPMSQPHPMQPTQMSPAVEASNTGYPGSEAASVFTQNQLSALKYQIYAYKLISKNMPIPPNIQQAVFSPAASEGQGVKIASPTVNPPFQGNTPVLASTAPNGVSPANSVPVPAPEKLVTPQAASISPQLREPEFNAYASPYHLLKKPISSYAHASRQQRLLIPSITPCGIDVQLVMKERERRIQARIHHRIDQLEKVAGTEALEKRMADLEKDIQSKGTKPGLRIKAVIELKALKLLEKQRKLREEFTNGVTKATVLATTVDRMAYRHMKKQSLHEARLTEKIERQQRIDREQFEKQKHLDYLQTICDHGRDLLATQRLWEAKQSKLGRAVVQFHQHIEKEEQKKAERISKERILALKNDDEEAYMKLIDEAKDTRLTQLLKQTGSFLESLTKAVLDQQNDSMYQGQGTGIDEVSSPTDESDTKVDYFQVTHRVKEEVQQPNMLVGGRLKDYQLKGLQWMVSLYNNHLNGILADEMGLGKTIQTLSLITYLIEKKRQNGPFLIIVPLSTITNWNMEFDKWAPSVSKIVYKGPPAVRRSLQQEIRHGDFQVLLTTFEYIIKDRPLLSKVKWLHMIVDEGHRMKNVNSKLTLALRQYYHSRYRLILTGTPLQNNLPELWALLNFILPKIFKSVKSFEEWFNTPFSNQGVQDKIDLNEEEQLLIIKRLHKVLRPFLLRRLKKDVEAELPDKVERVIKCKLSALQVKLYAQMKKSGNLYTGLNEKGRTGIKGLNNTLMQLRKICNHPFVFEQVENSINPNRTSNELLYRVAGKFELLDRMLPKLRQTGHRVLIFFQMTQIMSIMEDFLNYRGFTYLRLDGSTKADDRSQLLQVFNAPDSPYFLFLLSTRAGGLGLNLQTADTVIIFDSDWNPHQDLQAQDRAHRIGQTKEVRIFRLISANSIEENILAKANYKLDIDGKVIQAGKFDNRSTDEDREAFLRSLLEDKNDEDNDVDAEEEMDDEELNEMLKRSDEELTIFRKIDAERHRNELDQYRRMGGRGKKPERLIQEDELPEVYLLKEEPVPEIKPILDFGRGRRAKDDVRYDDGLTEEQWLNALENEDDIDELIEKNEQRRKRLMEAQETGDKVVSDTGSRRGRRQREENIVAYDEPYPSKKRGRPKKEEDPAKRKRSKKTESDPVPPEIRRQMTSVFEQCYKAVEESTEEDEHTYRQRAQLFMDLVSKRDYPMYYMMIKQPIAMKMIKKRIHSSHYKTIAQFRDDFHLMFDNARTFNEEGSIVYQDADEMQKIFDETLNRLCPGGMLPPLHNYSNGMAMQPPMPGKRPFAGYQAMPPAQQPTWNNAPTPRKKQAYYEDDDEEEEDDYEDDEYGE
ncbi:SNF2 family N-terminal domain-containing protein [Radiomyces spectabilis]|uniref:SNF2 family N-terminal domain-containing protein n=1 Tax=Radiomyces spectabilis TaxID=64574 RepID=UPI00221E65AD|nr:SNF2 family N-terminal domain-containing protein [Radiomyces spectabilis]KAI8384542.1 SNF2 family N-terminal domain-containing protein [Radiomyces spectabilis]